MRSQARTISYLDQCSNYRPQARSGLWMISALFPALRASVLFLVSALRSALLLSWRTRVVQVSRISVPPSLRASMTLAPGLWVRGKRCAHHGTWQIPHCAKSAAILRSLLAADGGSRYFLPFLLSWDALYCMARRSCPIALRLSAIACAL